MKNHPLYTYLNDHLSGATAAVSLIERCRERYTEGRLGTFFAELHVEVKRDREALQEVIVRVGGTKNVVKAAAGWLLEKAGRVKLWEAENEALELLEVLDGLSLGIQGKRALWAALDAALEADERFVGTDFAALKQRAERQHAEVEEHRLEAAQRAFAEAASP